MLDAISIATGIAIPARPISEVSPLQRWAQSGLMALTGRRDAAPYIATRDYCGRIDELAYGVEAFARAAGMTVQVGGDVTTNRAAWRGLKRDGAISANNTCRMLSARDGWIAVNLPRASDWDLLAAWLGCDVKSDDWQKIESIVRDQSREKIVERAQLLGVAVATVRDGYEAPPWIVQMGEPSPSKKTNPLVLDLSSLWAGPLCGALLAQAGADVIKMETRSRPDGARFGNPDFFNSLNANKRMLEFDPKTDRDLLHRLFAAADIVIEGSRPRVLTQWGFSVSEIFRTNPDLIWISVTGYGRQSVRANWVGFGDDVAAAAGLIADNAEGPGFIGDAIADPLAGLAAAASAFACLTAGGGFLMDANLFAAADFVASAAPIENTAIIERIGPDWILRGEGWSERVREPEVPPVHAKAKPLGADTNAILQMVQP